MAGRDRDEVLGGLGDDGLGVGVLDVDLALHFDLAGLDDMLAGELRVLVLDVGDGPSEGGDGVVVVFVLGGFELFEEFRGDLAVGEAGVGAVGFDGFGWVAEDESFDGCGD